MSSTVAAISCTAVATCSISLRWLAAASLVCSAMRARSSAASERLLVDCWTSCSSRLRFCCISPSEASTLPRAACSTPATGRMSPAATWRAAADSAMGSAPKARNRLRVMATASAAATATASSAAIDRNRRWLS